uniref:Large ribosomal subunit protein uL3c n=1 Tax=Pyropia perforata TaxID=182771 RepID=A0A023HRN6_PYRPE|nr:50S ribosomal protein L4 [Neoporphyra perforata]AGQ17128.1 50S ribosomal protein L4 [Neoporphyra perforata]AHB35090.1 50S ribosomal protein L4 [Neoporphyra perforata]AHB35299.1 50S ribosomal protein L4 [Neoporphyra perforata]AIA19461.1 50S ribosomal protein L4 [Neoporphyra perforata]AIA19670.1 50S ribosomal protein L4 [Neoporphyra perforata]
MCNDSINLSKRRRLVSVGILGTKVGMTQFFDEAGLSIPVTVIQVGPCIVTQIKAFSTDGYNAIQVGYKQVVEQKLNKPLLGHLKKSQAPPLKYLREYLVKSTDDFEVSQILSTEIFQVGETINVSSKSIGKGFSGYQKRHHFSRGPMSHGSKNHRQPGSIGAGTTPGRVYPGKNMAGQLGNKKVTIKNLQIVSINAENDLLIVRGAVPGKPGALVKISK